MIFPDSREVRWWPVHRFVEAVVAQANATLPIAGTPAWAALADGDPRKLLALAVAGEHWGIGETFTMRGKEDEDNERIACAIFNYSEIDILTGLESRQSSTILGTLKAFAMGEQLGSTNASKVVSRNVPAHSYRGCLSVGAQTGHTGVIFNDVTGGTPQRFVWANPGWFY